MAVLRTVKGDTMTRKPKQKKKFDWDYFLDRSEKKVVHCDNEEEAKIFCRLMHEHGLRWCGSQPYVLSNGKPNTKWTDWFGDVLNCYSNEGRHGSLHGYNEIGAVILKFSAYDFED